MKENSQQASVNAEACGNLAVLLHLLACYFLEGPGENQQKTLDDPDWLQHLADAGLVNKDEARGRIFKLDEHRSEFNRLFKIPGQSYIPPYEQGYRDKKATVDNAAPLECVKLYKIAQYRLEPYEDQQADHIGHQVRFLSALIDRQGRCLLEGKEKEAINVSDWIRGFFEDHCSWWTAFKERCLDTTDCQQIRLAVCLLTGLGGTISHYYGPRIVIQSA